MLWALGGGGGGENVVCLSLPMVTGQPGPDPCLVAALLWKWKPSLAQSSGPGCVGEFVRYKRGCFVWEAFGWVPPLTPQQFPLGFADATKPTPSVPTNCDSNPAS